MVYNPMDRLECVSCGVEKNQSEFGRDARKKNGLKSSCRECCNKQLREWRKRNPEKASEIDKRRYDKNPGVRRAASREWYEENKPRARENNIKWRNENPDKVREDGREQSATWRSSNPERAKENARNGQKRRRSDGRKRMEDALRSCISRSIRVGSKKGRTTYKLLGYHPDELRDHLERQFKPGMSWDNYGDWHIDHKMPLAAHNYETPDDEEFKAAWALSNLQPLWARDNQSKGAKMDWVSTLSNSGKTWVDGAANAPEGDNDNSEATNEA